MRNNNMVTKKRYAPSEARHMTAPRFSAREEQERHDARQAFMVPIGREAVKTRYPYGAQVPEWFWLLHEQTEIKAERVVNRAIGAIPYGDDAAWCEAYATSFPKMLARAIARIARRVLRTTALVAGRRDPELNHLRLSATV
jgi:hypothetical protein